MISIDQFIYSFPHYFADNKHRQPWSITADLSSIIISLVRYLGEGYNIANEIAIHKTAVVEKGAIIKGPSIIGKHCFIGANAYLRGGTFLGESVKIGTGCEVKTSILLDESTIAHFNFIGDSIIGSKVNFEAGSVTANHLNERTDKNIFATYDGKVIDTGCTKFGVLVGDNSKIGANAVLSPGTILPPGSIVKRLELIDQLKQ